jgi:hypothetical protein
MNSIVNSTSIVTAVRNRNDVFEQTLPNWLRFGVPEIVIVDFRDDGCCSVWDVVKQYNDPRIKVIETKYEYRWVLSIALNLAISQASYPYFLKLDVDYTLSNDFFVANSMRTREFISGYVFDPTSGLLLVNKLQFEAVGGYNENMMYWCGEDRDLYERLRKQKLSQKFVVDGTVTHYDHPRWLCFANQFQYLPENMTEWTVQCEMDKISEMMDSLMGLTTWDRNSPRICWSMTEISKNRQLAIRKIT